MLQNSTIQLKVDPKTKAEATALYEGIGLTLGDAIKLFLKQSINQNGLPFLPRAEDEFDFTDEEWEELRQSIKNRKAGKKGRQASTPLDIKNILSKS